MNINHTKKIVYDRDTFMMLPTISAFFLCVLNFRLVISIYDFPVLIPLLIS